MSVSQPDGYLAMPAAGKGKPVLVLHAWWGLNDTIKAFCDRLAKQGFVTFALDMYHGKVTDKIEEAEKLVGTVDSKAGEISAEIGKAIAFLKEKSGTNAASVALIGFSMGAFHALDASTNYPDAFKSVVIFYGTGPADFSKATAEYLGHFAGNDPYEPLESVKWLEGALKEAGRTVTFYQYEGTGHWFFEPDRADAYNEAAAKLAWERTLALLNR